MYFSIAAGQQGVTAASGESRVTGGSDSQRHPSPFLPRHVRPRCDEAGESGHAAVGPGLTVTGQQWSHAHTLTGQ
jgi:hypothetical protein